MGLPEVDWSTPELKRWLSSIANPKTIRNYQAAFKVFTLYTGKTSGQLIDEALADQKADPRARTDVVKTTLIGFYKWLLETYVTQDGKKGTDGKGTDGKDKDGKDKHTSQTTASMWVNCIRAFYLTYDINAKLKGRVLSNPKRSNKRIIMGPEQVNKLLNAARTPRDKLMILLAFQGGFGTKELLSLTFGDITANMDGEPPYRIDANRTKGGNVEYYTFVCSDTMEMAKLYISDMKRRGRKAEGKLFNLTENSVDHLMKRIAINSGLGEPKGFNVLGIHALRESFTSLMISSGVPDTTTDFWSGHSLGVMATAYKTQQVDLTRKMYAARMHLLTIGVVSNGKATTAELEKTNTELRKLETAKSELETKLGTVTENLRKVNEQLNAKPAVDEELMNHYHILEEKAAHLEARVQKLESLISRYFGSEFIAEVTTEAAEDSERIMPEDLNRAEKTPHKEELPPTKPKETKFIELDRLMAENQTLRGMLQKLVGA